MKKFLLPFVFLLTFQCLFVNSLAKDTNLFLYKSTGNFKSAVSITTDFKGNIYVLDYELCEIVKYNDNLKELKRIGKKGWGYGEFFNPTHIDGTGGMNLFVSDKMNSRIQVFDLNLGFINAIMTNIESIEERFRIRKPICSVLINSQDLYIIDGDDPRVVVFSSQKFPTLYFGSYQSGNVALVKPKKMVRDSKNVLYIFDEARSQILKYDNFGSYISSINLKDIISLCVYNDYIYILTNSCIYIYSAEKKAFTEVISFTQDFKNDLTDILVTSFDKIFILSKQSLYLYNKK
ncbi:MAG: hypothetical protein N2490_07990 [Ignavibacteria bacterium]|nr:hypothetical protein [Ignavibacteria bacterium]